MRFYQELSKHYEDVFPKGKGQIELLRDIAGNHPKKIIDIACGNGVYAADLAKQGHEVLGIDLSFSMIQKAHELAVKEQVNVELRTCSMLEIDEVVSKPCDMAFCIGNSLVHLRTLKEIQSFFNLAYGVLNNEGKLVIQIINYDKVIDKGVSALPTIENKEKELIFERNYILDEAKEQLEFKTVLTIQGKKCENSVNLIPLRKNQLVSIMESEGFKIEAVYGNFNKEPYNPDESFQCIVVAQK